MSIKATLRFPLRVVRDLFMIRAGLQPARPYVITEGTIDWDRGLPPAIEVPNLSKRYEPRMRALWEACRLGSTCLLVSENNEVRTVMQGIYPGTQFVTCDFFPELQVSSTDHIWDVCQDPPPSMSGIQFDSIIANALMEHVIDPTCAMGNFFKL